MDDQIEKLLELIATIVDDDTKRWTAKLAIIKAKASEMGERYEAALEEFTSWWDQEEE